MTIMQIPLIIYKYDNKNILFNFYEKVALLYVIKLLNN